MGWLQIEDNMTNKILAIMAMINNLELGKKAIADCYNQETDKYCRDIYLQWGYSTDHRLALLNAKLDLEREDYKKQELENLKDLAKEYYQEMKEESYSGIPISSYDDMAKAYSGEDADADYEREMYRQAHIAEQE